MSKLFLGYTEKELRDTFDLVTMGMDDWKMPIDQYVPRTVSEKLISAAVIYYTGCIPEVRPVLKDAWRVIADGYYMATVR
jgi:hypothetical protein